MLCLVVIRLSNKHIIFHFCQWQKFYVLLSFRRDGGLNSIISQLHNKKTGSDVTSINGDEFLDLSVRVPSRNTSNFMNGRKRQRDASQRVGLWRLHALSWTSCSKGKQNILLIIKNFPRSYLINMSSAPLMRRLATCFCLSFTYTLWRRATCHLRFNHVPVVRWWAPVTG